MRAAFRNAFTNRQEEAIALWSTGVSRQPQVHAVIQEWPSEFSLCVDFRSVRGSQMEAPQAKHCMVNQHFYLWCSTCALLRWLNPDWNIVWLHCIFSLEERFEKTQWLFRRRGHGISASLLLAGFVCENAEKCERFSEEWYRSGRQGWLACFSPQRHELYSFRLKEQQHQHNEAGMLAYLYWHSASRHHTHTFSNAQTL